jgi:hypothetical protein
VEGRLEPQGAPTAGWERLLPLTGVLSVALTVGGFILYGSMPDFIDKPQKIADFYTDDPGRVVAGAYVGMLGTVALIWFVGVLRARLRVAERGTGLFSGIAFAGGIAASAIFFLIDLFNAAGAFRADEDNAINPSVAASLNDLSGLSLSVGAFAMSVLVLATAAVILRTGVMPRWLGFVSILLGIALLTPIAYVALGLWLVWLFAVSILLYLRPEAASASPIPPVARTPV